MSNALIKSPSLITTLVKGKTIAHMHPATTAVVTTYYGAVYGTTTVVQLPQVPVGANPYEPESTIQYVPELPIAVNGQQTSYPVIVQNAYTTVSIVTTPGYYTYDVQPDTYLVTYGPNIGWSAAARSVGSLLGDGAVSFYVPISVTGVVAGLNETTDSAGVGYTEITYGILFTRGLFQITEQGSAIGATLPYVSTDVFTISRVGTTVSYYKNGLKIYTSLLPSTAELLLDSSLYTSGDTILNASFSTAGSIPGVDSSSANMTAVSSLGATPKATAAMVASSALVQSGVYSTGADVHAATTAMAATATFAVAKDFGAVAFTATTQLVATGHHVTEMRGVFGQFTALGTSGFASYSEIVTSFPAFEVFSTSGMRQIETAVIYGNIGPFETSVNAITGENVLNTVQAFPQFTVRSADRAFSEINVTLPQFTSALGPFRTMDDYSGCASISCNNYWGSGSLLWNGQAILTAAHVVEHITEAQYHSVDIFFKSTISVAKPRVTKIIIHPGYAPLGVAGTGIRNDLAIIILDRPVDPIIKRYDLYASPDVRTLDFTRFGYSPYLNPLTGETDFNQWSWHSVSNTFETYASGLPSGALDYSVSSGDLLVYDYDNGTVQRDALGGIFGVALANLGLAGESASRQGDSGSAAFINGQIAGVASFESATPYDITPLAADGTFGELMFDVRVSNYADWIGATVLSYVQLFPHTMNGDLFTLTVNSTGYVQDVNSVAAPLFLLDAAALGGANTSGGFFELIGSATGTLIETGYADLPLFTATLSATGTVFGSGHAELPFFSSTLTAFGGANAALDAPVFSGSSAGTASALGHAALPFLSFSASSTGTLDIHGYAELPFITFTSLWGFVDAHVNLFSAEAAGHVTVANAVAYVMNIHTNESTTYTAFDFMHVINIGGLPYGVKSDGLYLLRGDSDNGAAINGTITTKETDLGDFRSKNIPFVYLNSDTLTTITPYVDTVAQPKTDTTFGGRKAKLARGSKGRYWKIKVEHIKKLEGLEILADDLSRRVK